MSGDIRVNTLYKGDKDKDNNNNNNNSMGIYQHAGLTAQMPNIKAAQNIKIIQVHKKNSKETIN